MFLVAIVINRLAESDGVSAAHSAPASQTASSNAMQRIAARKRSVVAISFCRGREIDGVRGVSGSGVAGKPNMPCRCELEVYIVHAVRIAGAPMDRTELGVTFFAVVESRLS